MVIPIHEATSGSASKSTELTSLVPSTRRWQRRRRPPRISRRRAAEDSGAKPATGAGEVRLASHPPSARSHSARRRSSDSAASFDVRRPVLDRQAYCAKLRASCPFGRSALPQTSGGDVVALAGQGFERGPQQVLSGQGIPVVFGGSPSNRYSVGLQRRFDALGEDVGLTGIEAGSEDGGVVADR